MKKLLALSVIALTAASSQASYLWWEISASDVQDVTAYASSIETGWDTANLYAISTSSGEKTKLASAANVNEGSDYSGFTAGQSVDLGSYYSSGYSYYVELVNSTATPSTLLGYNAQTYESLSQSSVVTDSPLSLDSVTSVPIWHGGSGGYKAAPEPTSAMLMLLGVAGLALRRRQRKQHEA